MSSSSNKSVTVLLSAYNGERFLREQLDSLLAQENVNIKIVVRDDGSKDQTYSILDEYKSEKLSWYAGDNIGWAKSFMDLVKNAPESDYYAFCDQDDVWLPNKLEAGVKCLESKPGKGPKLYFCNQYYWRNGVISGKVHESVPDFNKYDCMVKNPSFGCTMVFNKSMIDAVKENFPDYITSHDYIFYQVAMTIGEVYYDHDAYMKYRIHGSNESGANKKGRELWRKRYKSLKKIFRDHDREYMAKELLRKFGHLMDDETRKIVALPANYRKNLLDYLKFLFSRKYVFHDLGIDFWLKTRILIRHF